MGTEGKGSTLAFEGPGLTRTAREAGPTDEDEAGARGRRAVAAAAFDVAISADELAGVSAAGLLLFVPVEAAFISADAGSETFNAVADSASGLLLSTIFFRPVAALMIVVAGPFGRVVVEEVLAGPARLVALA